MNEIKKDNSGSVPVDLTSVVEMLDGDEIALREVVDQFLIICPKHMEGLKNAINNKEFENVQKLAHSVKGLALNFRAKKVSGIAYELEKCGRDQQCENFCNLFNELSLELKIVINFFKNPDWIDRILGR